MIQDSAVSRSERIVNSLQDRDGGSCSTVFDIAAHASYLAQTTQ
jgi:hypothetical protein